MPTPALYDQAIDIVRKERSTWSDATAFVTEKVAFNMRSLIRQLRKNYWGIFDEPKDPTTGRKKIWPPLTESMVESAIKNVDLDTKDINFRAKKAEAVGLTSVVRSVVKNRLDEIYFGEILDEMERQLAIDGTAVWKTIETNEAGKKSFKIISIDLLNVYIDPTSRSIQEAYRFTERCLLTADEVKSMDWANVDDIEGSVGLARTDSVYSKLTNAGDTTKYIDVWELWGKIPKNLITGKEEDAKTEIDGHIIVSGLDSPGKEKWHLIEENKGGLKPYEEFWWTRISNRWYGKGVAEKLLVLQSWLNIIVNIRVNRSYVSQMGIFKIRKGSNLTPQILSRLAHNGALVVDNMQDIEQMVIQEASPASYNDENIIQTWAERVTSAFEVVTGENLPASTSATATALQSRNAQSQFVLIKEGIGMTLQRWLKRHVMPIIAKTITPLEVIRITGEPEELRELDERVVNQELYDQLRKILDSGKIFDADRVVLERQKALASLSASGKERFTKILEGINFSDYDVQVYITNEEIDKGVLVTNLISLLQTLPAIPNSGISPLAIVTNIMDVMGLDSNQLKAKQELSLGQVANPVANLATQPIQSPPQNLQQLVTGANTQ